MATFRILSLDGGGIRGLITAIWLERLERELGGPLREHFDLIAGTSTGAILACAVGLGIETAKVVDLYRSHGREVFPARPARLWSRLQRLLSDGPSAPRFDGIGLAAALERVFGECRFGDLQVRPTLITTYNALNREALILKNTTAAHASLRVQDVCMASAAAPAYFPAHVVRIGTADVPLLDGGVVANNPTVCAIAEAVKINDSLPAERRASLDDYVVASFGTGQTCRPIPIATARSRGALGWALPIIDVLFDGAAGATDYAARQLLADDGYFRFQTTLDAAYDEMDDARPENVNALAATAEHVLRTLGGDVLIANLAARLTGSRKVCELHVAA